MADNAIQQRKYVIQDAFEFLSWAELTQVFSKTLYKFISSEDVALCAEELKSMNPRPVHGTTKLHVPVGSVDDISYCNAPCYCVNCFNNGVFTNKCDGQKSFSRSQILESASTATKKERLQKLMTTLFKIYIVNVEMLHRNKTQMLKFKICFIFSFFPFSNFNFIYFSEDSCNIRYGLSEKSAKWCACVLACLACFVRLACSRDWHASMLYMLARLAWSHVL